MAIKLDNDRLFVLDQRKLPREEDYIEINSADEMCAAIKNMAVRGAPLIGIATAFGVYLSVRKTHDIYKLKRVFYESMDCLSKTRPTAVNLFYALSRMKAFYEHQSVILDVDEMIASLKQEAMNLWNEQKECDKKIGANGALLLKNKKNILTHCNAGSLATGGIGTALGIIKTLHKRYTLKNVIVDETRPYLQGARLTAFELERERIPYTVATDSSCGILMKKGLVDAVVVGADRIASNGDTANKIGTYCIAVLAYRHNIPFLVAAPESTIDRHTASGDDIVVEERSADEVLYFMGKQTAPSGSKAFNYSFDLTDNELISAIVTENGVYKQPFNF